ncbi:MAG TPA: efflux RND transporter periplasmic adaptor subunit [Burkholderiales bacterium]|nr:efflux RND transporter periplasmic adaptor subunit [Burkholderiales bacterium]
MKPHIPPAWRLAAAWTLVLLAAAGCSEKPQPAPEPRLVAAIRVAPGSSNGDIGYSGEVRARYESNLGFRVPGKIVARNVEVGSLVRQGDVLARLDPEDQELNTRGAQSQLAAAKSEYEQAKAELERQSDLFRKNFISRAEIDRWQNTYNVAKARYEQAQTQLAVTKNQAGYTELAADHAGVVTAILVEVGQVVAAGQTAMKLARTDDREVVIAIPENRLSELGNAREIDISLWADPSKSYKGKLREVSPAADPVTRTYAAKITVLNADAAMKLGMTANAYLRGVQRTAAVMLPATALFQDGGHAAVWVVDPASSKVKLVPVEVGEYVDDRVAVLSGLNAGDLVVRAGVHKLFAGEKVRAHEEPVAEAQK